MEGVPQGSSLPRPTRLAARMVLQHHDRGEVIMILVQGDKRRAFTYDSCAGTSQVAARWTHIPIRLLVCTMAGSEDSD